MPDYASAIGGIQTLSRFLVRALREILPEARICVISKNDTSYPELNADWTTTFTPLGWWPPKLRTVSLSVELFRRAAFERPDLIITTHPNFSPVAYWLEKAFGIPYVAIGNGIDVWEIRSSQTRAALRNADQLLAISEYTRKRMASVLDLDASDIALFPCTVDPEEFVPKAKPRFLRKRYGLREEQPVILTITRLASAERYKGYDQILSALPAVRERFHDVQYILGGRGPDHARIEALIKDLGVGENVILAGYVPAHELCEHYNLCDIFAMPSKGEGFGIVFLEAIACGKPVIAGNKDGSVDAVLNGEIGALVDPDDVAQIAETLIAILARKVGSRKAKGENAEACNSELSTSYFRLSPSSPRLPDIMFDPEGLRARVIDAYGYERFVERLRDVLKPFVDEKAESLKC